MIPKKWTSLSDSTGLKLCKMAEQSNGAVVVSITLFIKSNLSWTLQVCDRHVTQCTAIEHLPSFVTPQNVNELLQHIDRLSICPGHPDEHFVEMAKKKKTVKDGLTSFNVDEFADITFNGHVYYSTLRVSTCEMLVPNGNVADV